LRISAHPLRIINAAMFIISSLIWNNYQNIQLAQ
jgi:hypothetical protein